MVAGAARSRAAVAFLLVLLMFVAGMLAGGTASPAAGDSDSDTAVPAGRRAADPIAHDPTIIRQGRYFYSFITGDIATRTYLPIRRTTDLLHWTTLGTVFASPPDWVVSELGFTPGDFWAPDITFFDGLYHLYYAASSFGTNHSVIGLATTPTLDPASPDYRWSDRGMVLRSTPADSFNAIDPELVLDADGSAWLAFGSFWDGIKMRRIDRATGLLSPADQTLHPIASRGGASIEGPSIVRHDGYYYLFASLDFCCRGTDSDYRLVVGRAARITGPYTDRDGVPMLAGGGTDVLRGYNEFRGPGGADMFAADGSLWLAHHYYDLAEGGLPKQSIRHVSWRDGWPLLGDPLSGSSQVGHGNAYLHVISRGSGAVMDNPTCGYEGADIRLSEPNGSTCQQWRLEDRGGGYVSLLNRASNKIAEVAACVNADGARVAQWGWLNNDCQKFRFTATGDGWSVVENRLAGRILAPAECAGPGSAIQTVTRTGETCQEFRVDPIGDVLIADDTATSVLDVAGCGRYRGAPVTIGPRRATPCQLWRFTNTDQGYFQVLNVASSRPLTTHPRSATGVPLLVLGDRDRPTPASQWRIEATGNGSYHLINREGWTADAGTNGTQQFRLLSP